MQKHPKQLATWQQCRQTEGCRQKRQMPRSAPDPPHPHPTPHPHTQQLDWVDAFCGPHAINLTAPNALPSALLQACCNATCPPNFPVFVTYNANAGVAVCQTTAAAGTPGFGTIRVFMQCKLRNK